MSVYTEYVVDRVEKQSHTRGCPWHHSSFCACKRPDVIVENSAGVPFVGFSRLGYEVKLTGEADHVR